MSTGSALAFGRSDEASAHPLTDREAGALSGVADRGVLVGGEADVAGDAVGVIDGRSAGSGHAATISDTQSLAKSDIRGYGKSMAATQQERQYEIEIGKRCELGHKVCTDCLGCCCDSNPRVMTDKKGRTLCAACRDVWTAGGQCR